MILHSLRSWILLQFHIIVQLQSVLLQEQPTSKWYVSRNLTTISKEAWCLLSFVLVCVEINIPRLRLLILRQMNDHREKNDNNNDKVRKKKQKKFSRLGFTHPQSDECTAGGAGLGISWLLIYFTLVHFSFLTFWVRKWGLTISVLGWILNIWRKTRNDKGRNQLSVHTADVLVYILSNQMCSSNLPFLSSMNDLTKLSIQSTSLGPQYFICSCVSTSTFISMQTSDTEEIKMRPTSAFTKNKISEIHTTYWFD